jgi:hypothetical protein
MYKKIIFFCLLAIFFTAVPFLASAHQPRIVEQNKITVLDPEISKAYYAELKGNPQVYDIKSDKPFNLYVNLTVPDVEGQRTDFGYYIYKDGNLAQPLSQFYGGSFQWSKFWEKFGRDSYLEAASYQNEVEAGDYQIQVMNIDNQGKYVLAIGEKENFDFKESMNAINLIPKIKRDFFNESPINFILSPFGYGYIILIFILAFIFSFIIRLMFKKLAKNPIRKVNKNINTRDRLISVLFGIGLLLWVITTTWNPVILFLAGLCFFEVIFSWCMFYAMWGKNTRLV